MRHRRIVLIASLLACGLTLSACESFDPSEWFNSKKKLPGDRKDVFPGGVPGVPQGVPQDMVQGYQPPPEAPPAPVVEDKPKPKPKPKPKQAAAPAARPPAIATPQQQGGQSPQAAQAPWPDSQSAAPQPAPAQSPFPDPPRR
jgi:hypothetical protein